MIGMQEDKKHAFDSDQALIDPKDDRLMRDGFSKELAEHIGSWTGKESIVIGINGDWGTGKSTVKNFIKHYLSERHREPTIVEFNPWEWSGQKKLIEGFLSQVGVALGKEDKAEKFRAIAKKWKKFASYVQFSGSLEKTIKEAFVGIFGTSAIGLSSAILAKSALGIWPIVAIAVVTAISGAIAFIPAILNATIQLFEDKAGFHEKSIEDVKKELSNELINLKAPLVIFLDDVDRLTDDEIKILFQLIKANCQFPNLIYVVLFEREIVETALDKIVSGGGSRYLRKIVQHSFDLPQPSSSRLRKIIAEYLDNALFKSEIKGVLWNEERWQDGFAEAFFGWFPSIRDAKRFIGSLKFVLARHSPNGVLEVDAIDLVIIEALRTMHYEVYRRIATGFHAKGRFENILFGREEMQKAFQSQIKVILQSYADQPEAQATLQRVLVRLFPQANEQASSHEGMNESWRKDMRVCHPKHFLKYFELSLEENDISALLINEIIASSGNTIRLSSIFKNAKKQGHVLDLFEAIFAIREQIPTQNLAAFITALFDSGDDFFKDQNSFFQMDSEMVCIRIIHHRLKNESPDIVFRSLKHAYDTTSGIVVPVRYLAVEDERSCRHGQGDNESIIPEEFLAVLRESVLKLIRTRAQDETILSFEKCAAILFRWRDWAGEEEVKTWTTKILADPRKALKLLERLLTVSQSSSSRKEYWLQAKSIESLVNLDCLLNAVNSIDKKDIEQHELLAIKLLERAIENKNSGRGYSEIRIEAIEYENTK